MGYIEKGHPELYKKCGTYKWWKHTFNLDRDRTYETIQDVVEVIKKKPAKSKKLIETNENHTE